MSTPKVPPLARVVAILKAEGKAKSAAALALVPRMAPEDAVEFLALYMAVASANTNEARAILAEVVAAAGSELAQIEKTTRLECTECRRVLPYLSELGGHPVLTECGPTHLGSDDNGSFEISPTGGITRAP